MLLLKDSVCSALPVIPTILTQAMSKVRPALRQILDICLILSSTYMLWETLRMITNSPSPIVVVISESMEPAFSRGDLLFLWNRDENVEVWDIAVCWFEGRDLPMVHRVVKRFPLPVTAEPRNRYVTGFKDGFGCHRFQKLRLTGSLQDRIFSLSSISALDEGRQ